MQWYSVLMLDPSDDVRFVEYVKAQNLGDAEWQARQLIAGEGWRVERIEIVPKAVTGALRRLKNDSVRTTKIVKLFG